jgi:hypothetical protein
MPEETRGHPDQEVVRVERTRTVPDDLVELFDSVCGKGSTKKGLKKGSELLCGYNAAGERVISTFGGDGMRIMTTTGWQDGKGNGETPEETAERREREIALLKKLITPSKQQ